MTDETKLEACRWCDDADAELVHSTDLHTHASQRAVQCRTCGATGPVKDTEAEAIAAWNTRPSPPVEGLVEQVARALAKQFRTKTAGFREAAKRQQKRVGPLAKAFDAAAAELERGQCNDVIAAALRTEPASPAGECITAPAPGTFADMVEEAQEQMILVKAGIAPDLLASPASDDVERGALPRFPGATPHPQIYRNPPLMATPPPTPRQP